MKGLARGKHRAHRAAAASDNAAISGTAHLPLVQERRTHRVFWIEQSATQARPFGSHCMTVRPERDGVPEAEGLVQRARAGRVPRHCVGSLGAPTV